MLYSCLGSSGLIVSRAALGAMTFTQGGRRLPSIFSVEPPLAKKIVDCAIDAGVNLFDTADGYSDGDSEIMLGEILKPHRNNVIISTKVGLRRGEPVIKSGLTRRHIFQSVDESLKRLGTDWIDLYIAHREDPITPLEETLSAFDSLVRNGKVRYLGFSNWSAWRAAAALEFQQANGLAMFTHGQMHYALLGRDVERDIIPMMKHYGLGMTVWSPLSGGFLSGKYTRKNINDTGTRFSQFFILPIDLDHGFKVLDLLHAIASRHRATVSQIAAAWLLTKPVVNSILIGVSKLSHIEDNLGAFEVRLGAEDMAELEALTEPVPVYPNWFRDKMVDRVTAAALSGARNG